LLRPDNSSTDAEEGKGTELGEGEGGVCPGDLGEREDKPLANLTSFDKGREGEPF